MASQLCEFGHHFQVLIVFFIHALLAGRREGLTLDLAGGTLALRLELLVITKLIMNVGIPSLWYNSVCYSKF